jgi:hypothetical protein
MVAAPPPSNIDQAEARAIVPSFRAGTNLFVRELAGHVTSLMQALCAWLGAGRAGERQTQAAEAAPRVPHARACTQTDVPVSVASLRAQYRRRIPSTADIVAHRWYFLLTIMSREDKRDALYDTLLLCSLDKRTVFDSTFLA